MSRVLYETPACALCGRTTTVTLSRTVVDQLGTVPVQDLLPETAPSIREQIRHGTHPACWAVLFGPDGL